jgi:hypothetical protein
MSRRHSAEKREIIPDAKFGDIVVAKFMNTIMYEGKKSVAEQIVYGALDGVQAKAKADPLPLFKQALDNVAPSVEVRSPARPTRFPSKCAPSAVRLWRSAGSSTPRASATTRRWWIGWRMNCLTPQTTGARP